MRALSCLYISAGLVLTLKLSSCTKCLVACYNPDFLPEFLFTDRAGEPIVLDTGNDGQLRVLRIDNPRVTETNVRFEVGTEAFGDLPAQPNVLTIRESGAFAGIGENNTVANELLFGYRLRDTAYVDTIRFTSRNDVDGCCTDERIGVVTYRGSLVLSAEQGSDGGPVNVVLDVD